MSKKDAGENAVKGKHGPWDGKNYSFPVFDRSVMSWCRTKWGEELGRSIWENKFPAELFEIPEGTEEWAEHCELVHRHNP